VVRERRSGEQIACIGIESSKRLGRHWWVVGRTITWLGATAV